VRVLATSSRTSSVKRPPLVKLDVHEVLLMWVALSSPPLM
jgi:hypothetical protein